MSIASAPFLFLFLPAVVGIYYLIPEKDGLKIRNVFLLVAGLFFYTWGEPLVVFLLLGMIFVTWYLGKIAYKQKGTKIGKRAIFLTVFINVVVILIFGKLDLWLKLAQQLIQKDLSNLAIDFPIGFTFFIFSSISYVVDSYRGQSKSSDSLLDAALYTSAFFKILQGPIISYRKFKEQLLKRQQSMDCLANGIWRFTIGLSKKIVIADNVAIMVKMILTSDLTTMPLLDAWLGCISYLVYLYFDFSGYSDMAIGLAEVFGFTIPENFNYPYISTSIKEFWNRFHMTLCAWFTEYLYYPILLGPSVRFRKYLARHHISDKTAKSLQNVFVIGTVWLVTSVWHGINIRYAIWGLMNCIGMLLEAKLKPIGNKRLNTIVRRAGFFLYLFLTMPLISLNTINDALLFYKAMFTGSFTITDSAVFEILNYGFYLLMGIIGCFPVVPYIKKKLLRADEKYHRLWDVCACVVMIVLLAASISFLLTRDTIYFLYQQ